jgi:hypothetical protein
MRLFLTGIVCLASSIAFAQDAAKPAPPKAARTVKADFIPLPRPRPPEAGPGNAEQAAVPAEPPPPSECFVALTTGFAVATSLPPIALKNGCEAPDVLRLDAVLLPDNKQITFNPPATLRCSLATEIVSWIRDDLVPSTSGIGTLTAIENGSFECRGRNRVVGAKLSEHGKANALDIGALLFTNKKRVNLTDWNVMHDFREKIRENVCGRFMTVLGPGSDGYHEEHIHLDLAERKNNYKICQWNVLDVPLPVARPPEADIAWAEAEKKEAEEAAAAAAGATGKKP